MAWAINGKSINWIYKIMSDKLSIISEYLNTNKIDDAYEYCQSWLNVEPSNPQACHTMALLLIKRKMHSQAIDYFHKAIKFLPGEASFHTNIANTYKYLGALQNAEIHYKQALNLNPNATLSYNNLGALYYTQGKYDNAMLLFEKSLRLSPNNWETHCNLANCLINLDFTERAVIHYEIAHELNPNYPAIEQNLAMAYVIEKQFSKAMPLLKKACDLEPEHSELQTQLAEVYLEAGEPSKAIEQHLKALTLNPNNHPLAHNLAVLYLRNKELNKAQEYFQKAFNLDAQDLTAKHMLNALSDSKQIEQAPAKYVEELFNQYAQFYNKHVSDKLAYKTPEIMRSLISKFLGDKAASIRILDLGCGTGLCGIYFSDLSFFMIGVDISREMLAYAKAIQSYDGLCQLNILDAIPGENSQSFDLILAADVFVYLGDLKSIFKKAHNSLADNGIFCFSIETNKYNNNHSHKLLTSGRFAHSHTYINEIASEFNFKVALSENVELRKDNEQNIAGSVFILIKN